MPRLRPPLGCAVELVRRRRAAHGRTQCTAQVCGLRGARRRERAREARRAAEAELSEAQQAGQEREAADEQRIKAELTAEVTGKVSATVTTIVERGPCRKLTDNEYFQRLVVRFRFLIPH